MNHGQRTRLAAATVSMAAALASPTFGINLAFDTTRSSIIYTHDAEFLDPVNSSNFFRTKTVAGNQIAAGTAPGYQLPSGTVNQNGGATTGSSTGRIGIGHVSDSRTASMTLQSLSFVNQNEVDTPTASLKMDGSSIISADFTMAWKATGAYGPPLVGRISIPLSGFVVGTGTASVTLENVRWIVDEFSDGQDNLTAFDARTAFSGSVNFVAGGPTTATLSSTSVPLTKSGASLGLKKDDILILKGKLIFAADGNSPASINFGQIGADYGDSVIGDEPSRFYRLNEDGFHTNPFPPVEDDELETFDTIRTAYDHSGNGWHGEYVGQVTPESRTASAGMGTGAYFPETEFESASLSGGPSITPSGLFDAILAPNAADVQFGSGTGGESFTLEAWVAREGDFGTSTYFPSVIDMQDGNGDGLRFGINNNTIFLTGGTGGTDAVLDLGPGEFFQFGEFYHLVAVFDELDGKVHFFVNGDSVGDPLGYDYALLTNSIDDFIRFGNDINGLSPFLGVIDEVAIYGSVLDVDTIADHYDAGKENLRIAPLMGFVEIPEPASASLALLAIGSIVLPRRRQQR